MPYDQGMYDKMAGEPKAAKPKMKGGRYAFDMGYKGQQSGHYEGMYKERGNDYNAIQNKIAKENKAKMKGQMYDNY